MIKKSLSKKLKNPILVAAWPGMGNVALKAANYLQEELSAQEYGVIEPEDFFTLSTIFIHNGLIEKVKLPISKFYYWKNEKGRNDLLIFTSESQPISGKEIRFSNLILEVAKKEGVEKIITFAAMSRSIDHHAKPSVWGTATSPELLDQLKKLNLNILNEGYIGGLNGVFLGIAKESDFDGICLLGEIPSYATHIENPRASLAVLEVFTKITEISLDLSKLSALAEYMEKEIDHYLLQFKEQFSQKDLPDKEKDKGPPYVH